MSAAEQAWEAHYRRIYPEDVFTPAYMKGDGRPAFIAAKKAGFLCGWEEAADSRDQRIRELQALVKAVRHERAIIRAEGFTGPHAAEAFDRVGHTLDALQSGDLED